MPVESKRIASGKKSRKLAAAQSGGAPVCAIFEGQEATAATQALLGWYDRHARVMPWRIGPGEEGVPDPYHIWLSEVMLQQTTVAAVKTYFTKFTTYWKSVEALASASPDDVMAAWAGLGYYARARNLHACAQKIRDEHGGQFPDTESGLRALPGVGEYTAAAIAAIAFGRHAVVVDANVERVAARLGAIREPLPAAKAQIRALVAAMAPSEASGRAGDFAQAMMDLGATICTVKAPKCLLCPLTSWCQGAAQGIAESLPVKAPKKARPARRGWAWWIERDGHVLLVRRPAKGLLGGMLALPGSDWVRVETHASPALRPLPADAPPGAVATGLTVQHIFTHFALSLDLARSDTPPPALDWAKDGLWVAIDKLDEIGLPSLYKKAVFEMRKA